MSSRTTLTGRTLSWPWPTIKCRSNVPFGTTTVRIILSDQVIASAGKDNKLVLSLASDGNLLWQIEDDSLKNSWINEIDFSSNSELLVTGMFDASVLHPLQGQNLGHEVEVNFA